MSKPTLAQRIIAVAIYIVFVVVTVYFAVEITMLLAEILPKG